jgi:hypothetical protein
LQVALAGPSGPQATEAGKISRRDAGAADGQLPPRRGGTYALFRWEGLVGGARCPSLARSLLGKERMCCQNYCGGPASPLQCPRGLMPALGVGDRRFVWVTALFSGRASRACQPSRCQKKSTSAFRHTPLACSLTLVLRKTVVRWKSKYFAWASRRVGLFADAVPQKKRRPMEIQVFAC